MTTNEPELLTTMIKAVEAIDEQIQRLRKAKAEIIAAFPELQRTYPTHTEITGTGLRNEASSPGEILKPEPIDYSLPAALRKLENGSWKNTIAALLREKGKLRRKEIIERAQISKHTLNALLSKHKELFQRDEVGFWSLRNEDQGTGNSAPTGENSRVNE